MSELKKCPFCGGEALLRERYINGTANIKHYRRECRHCKATFANWYRSIKKADEAWNRRAQPEITGETSDGYHTFNELYHHRAVLFSVICNATPELAWKSKLHHDGTMYDGMFIVGIETPDGQATYHYDIDPYWEMFDVQELPKAPEWDGHTPTQAIERIGKLRTEPKNEPLTCKDCVYWKDRQVQLRDGSCRDYLPNEPWSVTADVGINVASHCTLHGFDNESGSWFWAKAEDFCSRGIRKPERSEG